jgi:hypothetical protein
LGSMTTFNDLAARGAFDGLKSPKYRNKATHVDGIRFASKAEAKRWGELCLLERAGEIHDLKRQVPFPLYVNDKLVARYVADATYRQTTDGVLVVEDVKGAPLTDVFRLKAKMFEAHYGYPITIVGRAK